MWLFCCLGLKNSVLPNYHCASYQSIPTRIDPHNEFAESANLAVREGARPDQNRATTKFQQRTLCTQIYEDVINKA